MVELTMEQFRMLKEIENGHEPLVLDALTFSVLEDDDTELEDQ